jgi:hypothetical protein
MSASHYSNDMTFPFKYGAQTFNAEFLGVEQATVSFTDDLDGVFGLERYGNNMLK